MTSPRRSGASAGSWQQPVMTLGVLLIIAAALLPIAGGLMRYSLDEQAKQADREFVKAVAGASDAHGPLVSALSGRDVEEATEALTRDAYAAPGETYARYSRLHAAYAQLIADQGRPDLQPRLDAAKQAYQRVEQAREHARGLWRRHHTVLGQYLRYAGLAGSVGLVLVIWTAVSGLVRRGAG